MDSNHWFRARLGNGFEASSKWSRSTIGAMNVAVSLLSLEGARSSATDQARERLDEVVLLSLRLNEELAS